MRNHRQGSTKNSKTDSSNLFLSWLQGIWSSLRRFIRRLLRPNRGRRIQVELHSADARISPLMGTEKFRRAESLTMGELMAKVQWRAPKQPAQTAPAVDAFQEVYPVLRISPPNLQPVLDRPPETTSVPSSVALAQKVTPATRISPLMGVEQFPHVESLTVGNLLATVQWQAAKQAPHDSAAPSIASVQEKIDWD
jgi:hypothetical protein